MIKCQGIKADGTKCQATRPSNIAKPSHLVTAQIWYCHRHKDQEASSGPAAR